MTDPQHRFALVREDGDETTLALCADVDGLFVDPPRRPFELPGCTPAERLLDALKRPAGVELGDLWVQPQGDGQLPSDSERLDPWQLLDIRVLDHRPNSRDASLVDLVVEAAESCYGLPDDPYLAAGVRFYDEREFLGVAEDFVEIVPAGDGPADEPLRLLGCAASDELTAALTAPGRRARELGEVWLRSLDPAGAPSIDWGMNPTVADWRPSALGPGLVDITLDARVWDPPSLRHRPIWERWMAGPPQAPNLWTALGTRERDEWLTCVRRFRMCGGRITDDASGSVYHLDGRHATDEPGVLLALGEAVNGPGGYFGGCLAAVHDCLGGRFGATTPFTLVWHHADTARRHLGRVLSPNGEWYSYFDEVLDILTKGRVDVVFR